MFNLTVLSLTLSTNLFSPIFTDAKVTRKSRIEFANCAFSKQFYSFIRSSSESSSFKISSTSFSNFLSTVVDINAAADTISYKDENFIGTIGDDKQILFDGVTNDLEVTNCNFKDLKSKNYTAIRYIGSGSVSVIGCYFDNCTAYAPAILSGRTVCDKWDNCDCACICLMNYYDNGLKYRPYSLNVKYCTFKNSKTKWATYLEGAGATIKSQAGYNDIQNIEITGDYHTSDYFYGPNLFFQYLSGDLRVSDPKLTLKNMNMSNFKAKETNDAICLISYGYSFDISSINLSYLKANFVQSKETYAKAMIIGEQDYVNSDISGKLSDVLISNVMVTKDPFICFSKVSNEKIELSNFHVTNITFMYTQTIIGGTSGLTIKNVVADIDIKQFYSGGTVQDFSYIGTSIPTATSSDKSSSSSFPLGGIIGIVLGVIVIVALVIVIIIFAKKLKNTEKKASTSASSSSKIKAESLAIADQTISYGTTTIGPTQDNPLYSASFEDSSDSDGSVKFHDDSDDNNF